MNYNLIDDKLCIPMLQFFNDYLNMPTKDSWDAKKNWKLALTDLIIMKMRYHHNNI